MRAAGELPTSGRFVFYELEGRGLVRKSSRGEYRRGTADDPASRKSSTCRPTSATTASSHGRGWSTRPASSTNSNMRPTVAGTSGVPSTGPESTRGPVSRRSCLSNHVPSAGPPGDDRLSTWSRSPRPMARRAVFFTLRLPQSWPAMTVWFSVVDLPDRCEATLADLVVDDRDPAPAGSVEPPAGRTFQNAPRIRLDLVTLEIPVTQVGIGPARDHEAWEGGGARPGHEPEAHLPGLVRPRLLRRT